MTVIRVWRNMYTAGNPERGKKKIKKKKTSIGTINREKVDSAKERKKKKKT